MAEVARRVRTSGRAWRASWERTPGVPTTRRRGCTTSEWRIFNGSPIPVYLTGITRGRIGHPPCAPGRRPSCCLDPSGRGEERQATARPRSPYLATGRNRFWWPRRAVSEAPRMGPQHQGASETTVRWANDRGTVRSRRLTQPAQRRQGWPKVGGNVGGYEGYAAEDRARGIPLVI